uniref:K Homology domain-containing protein n=1 Tax=Ditylenchus dipsaci TaxID=166011 RepID=A0A915D0S1_9BILA
MVIEPQMADFLGSTASSTENGVVSGGCFNNGPSLSTNSYPTYLPTTNNCSNQMVAAGGLSSPCSSSSSSVVVPSISVILTVRLLMQGKEVGSIIGKRGDHVKLIRDKSGAKVNISDGSCPERIVTITGNTNTIHAAFAMVARKFEEDLQALPNSVPKPPITMRLIVPATQCGSLIGKGGSKIKEIREKTGASIQVATEMLPSSTERAVTISGTCEALTDCMHEICQILLEAPPKGATLPFRPKPSYNPLMVASSAAAAAAAQQQASQHIAAALLQQGGANPGQQPYGTAVNSGGAPSSIPTHHSTTAAALQELARLHPRFHN